MSGRGTFAFVGGTHGVSDVYRRQITRSVWGDDEIPTVDPSDVQRGYTGTSFRSDYPTLASRCDLVVCPLPRGGVSNVHLIHPPYGTAVGRVVVVRGGHQISYYDDTGYGMLAMTQAMVAAGYHVLGICMPCSAPVGFNVTPLVLDKVGGGTMSFPLHEFQEAEDDGVACLRLFVDPVVTAVRWAIAELAPKSVDMVGLSGGGWTTDLCTALCRLIRRSVPVFGSLPFHLRPPGDKGDWEQSDERMWWDPVRYSRIGPVETIYALGSAGTVSGRPGEVLDGLETGVPRRRLQVLGPFDPVFPVSTVLDEVAAYDVRVRSAVGDTSGVTFDITTTEHKFTAFSIAAALDIIGAP